MKPHPVEARDAAWIAEAVEFTATVYYGRKHHTVRTATMAEAAQAALALEAALRRGGVSKGVLVYAITDRGRSTLVPEAQWRGLATPEIKPQVENTPDDCAGASQEPTMQTYSTKSNAKKAAKKAGHPDAFISYNPKLDRWHWDVREPQERADDALDALARTEQADPAEAERGAEFEAAQRAKLDAANREAIATTEKGEPIPAFLKREQADRAAVLAHAKPATDPVVAAAISGGGKRAERVAKLARAEERRAAKAAPAPAATNGAAPKRVGKALAQHEAAKRGVMPPVPALESAAHKGYWKHRDAIAKLAAERNVDALRAYPIELKCSSRIPLVRFIEDTLIALEAGA